MSIAIRGIRIKNISMQRDDSGKENITGDYELISTADKVLAKQGFNSYNEITVGLSGDTMKAYNAFTTGLKNDIQNILGLTEGE